MQKAEFDALVTDLRRAAVNQRSDVGWAENGKKESESERELKTWIEQALFSDPRARYADAVEKQRVAETVFNSMRRLDVLEPLLQQPDITEIMVNGPARIFVEQRGQLRPAGVQFESRERLEELIRTLAARVNRSVNESDPIVDARLEDGSRIHAILSPVALDGPFLTIRRFPETPLDMKALIASGTITEEAADFLLTMVRARYNLFVCGGTGSGKTTFLNVLSAAIGPQERIVTMEDSAELQLSGIENLARLETRMANSEGRGEITMKQLIRASLRMRPDRIIVGEVRGEEAFDMLQAMNTGHDGSMSTGHANSPDDMMSRLEGMVSMAADLPLPTIRKQMASAIEVVVFLQRLRDHSRRVMEISEVIGYDAEGVRLSPLFQFEEIESVEGIGGRVMGQLVPTKNALKRVSKLRLRGMSWPLGNDVKDR